MSLGFIESGSCHVSSGTPRLTIGIPTWNREALLRAQLEALTPHLRYDVELLVCDNGSTDGTWKSLQAYRETASYQFRCIRNGTNLGADVNYLRVLEAASGEWVWLVGDDDRVDFSLIPLLLSQLAEAPASVVLLLDEKSSAGVTTRHIDTDDFFSSEYDEIGMHILQVGRVICRTTPTRPLLREAYSQAVGHLHSYSALYGPLITQDGIDVLVVPLLTEHSAEPPRWNLLSGFLGAWESSLEMYGEYRKPANEREIRLRQKPLLLIAISYLILDKPLTPHELSQMYRRFSFSGRLMLFAIRAAFSINRTLAIRALSRLKPTLVTNIRSSVSSQTYDY